jgi:hypothetical protein
MVDIVFHAVIPEIFVERLEHLLGFSGVGRVPFPQFGEGKMLVGSIIE